MVSDLVLLFIFIVFPLCVVILLGARTSPLGILLPCTASGGIRVKVVPECVDRSPKLRQFIPGFAKKVDLGVD